MWCIWRSIFSLSLSFYFLYHSVLYAVYQLEYTPLWFISHGHLYITFVIVAAASAANAHCYIIVWHVLVRFTYSSLDNNKNNKTPNMFWLVARSYVEKSYTNSMCITFTKTTHAVAISTSVNKPMYTIHPFIVSLYQTKKEARRNFFKFICTKLNRTWRIFGDNFLNFDFFLMQTMNKKTKWNLIWITIYLFLSLIFPYFLWFEKLSRSMRNQWKILEN